MKARRLAGFLVLLLFLQTVGTVGAEDRADITGKEIRGNTDDEIIFITGEVRIVQGEELITAERARIDTDKKKLLMEQDVLFISDDLRVNADMLEYDLNKKKGTFKGKVKLERIVAEKSSKEANTAREDDSKDPFILFTEELYFEVDEHNFVAWRGRIEHEDFSGEADKIEYWDKSEEMLFTDNGYLKNDDGEEVWGDRIRFKLKDKDFTVEDNVRITFEVDDDEEPEKDDPNGQSGENVEIEITDKPKEPK